MKLSGSSRSHWRRRIPPPAARIATRPRNSPLLNREENQPACIYFHPWEIDPDQPRLASGLIARVRTYTGVKGMSHKLDRLLSEFQFSTLSQVYGEVGQSAAIIAQ